MKKYDPISDAALAQILIELADLHPDSETRYSDQLGRLVARLHAAEKRLNAIDTNLTADFLKAELEAGILATKEAVLEGWDGAQADSPNVSTAQHAADVGVASFSMGFCLALEAIKTKAEAIRPQSPTSEQHE